MHYLFYGDDTFSINEKSKNLIKRFSEIHSDLNVVQLNGVDASLETFLQAALTVPFLDTAKLIIVKNLLIENKDSELKKEIAKNLEKIPKTTTVVFVEQGLPDMRSSLFKALNQPKIAQKFDSLATVGLGKWIGSRVAEEGGRISSSAKTKLEVFVGPDLWRLRSEIQKLVLFKQSCGGGEITAEDVDNLVVAENNPNIFQYTDALARKDMKKAAVLLAELSLSGTDPFYIFTMIVFQFRNLLFVSDLSERKLSPKEVASESKLHPFVVKKSMEVLRYYKGDALKRIFLTLQEIDCKIKSGLLSPALALDLLSANLTKA